MTLWLIGKIPSTITLPEMNTHLSLIFINELCGTRRVPLDPDTLQMLFDYVLARNIPEDRPVFSIKRTQAFNLVKKYGNMAGVKIHPHTLRHSFAIHLVRSGTDLRRVQLMLGHSSLSITQVYLQFNDNDLREAYEKVAF